MRSMVEGRPGLAFRQDHSDHGIQITEHVASGYSEYRKARPLQIGFAERIDVRLLGEIMSLTVDLDQQPS